METCYHLIADIESGGEMEIGKKIISLREARGWSQRELARRVDLHPSVMNRIESGDRPTKDHELAKISEVLGVSSDYLIGRSSMTDSDSMFTGYNSSLGDRLKTLREAKNLTTEQLGKRLNTDENSISDFETGDRRPDYETLKSISSFFNVSIDFLMTGEDQQGSSDEMWKELLDPKKKLFFKDLMDAPEEKIAELIQIWEIIKGRDK